MKKIEDVKAFLKESQEKDKQLDSNLENIVVDKNTDDDSLETLTMETEERLDRQIEKQVDDFFEKQVK
ncbi:MAG: hypothetical protein FWB90_02335 [Fibromonadales bacterium]|nr:hypothetical protein [Fibromonadales bacterium]